MKICIGRLVPIWYEENKVLNFKERACQGRRKPKKKKKTGKDLAGRWRNLGVVG